jgi:hypothetical protein
MPLEIPARRWQSVSLDLTTDLPSPSRGFGTVVVFVDRLSQVVHIAATTTLITGDSLFELFDRRVIRYQRVPQTDGPTEHANGVSESTLRPFVGPFQFNWGNLLPAAEFAMNNSVNVHTGHTPFMLHYGQPPCSTLAVVIWGMSPPIAFVVEALNYARQCLLNAHQRQKARSDKHRRDAPTFEPW